MLYILKIGNDCSYFRYNLVLYIEILNNKVVSIKITSTIFLAIVLITRTIAALSFPSFMITSAAQAQPYHGMDNRYNNYESDYGVDNSYQSQYQPSYKPDYYKPAYPSYGKDDRDKSKVSNIDINKIKCNNNNVNSNNGQSANNGNITTENETKNHESKKFNKDNFAFVCINNNNNTVIAQEEPPVPPVDECLLCFDETTQSVRDGIIVALEAQGPTHYCPNRVIP